MWQLFWLQNTHYVIEVFVAFLMITASWIYLDGWLVERGTKTFARATGFFALAIWSFLDAAPAGAFEVTTELTALVGLIGFGLVFVSLLIDPIPLRPGEKPIGILSRFWSSSMAILPISELTSRGREFVERAIAPILPVVVLIGGLLIEPAFWMFFLSALITILVYLHYSRGIQSEWKYFYVGFLFLTISLVFAFTSVWKESTNVLLVQLLSPYHAAWIIEHAVKLLGAIFLGAWAWGFIRFRIFPQIFSSFIALSFIIFILVTIIFTGFLLNRTQGSAAQDLETNVRTLNFAIGKVKESAILAARIASSNPQVREAVKRNDKEALFSNLNALMFENGTDFMLAVNTGGEVLMRAEDKERFGDSLADDPVVWRSLDGKAVVTTLAERGITLPAVSIRAASPIVDASEAGELEIIGSVVTGYLLDTAFVDGIKQLTGLDVTVFAGDVSAATTFVVPGGQLRMVGAREPNKDITDTVLKTGKTYTGEASVLSRPFLASYVPVKDIEETTVGMFFTGKSQAAFLASVSDTIQLTFSISIVLMIFSIIPLWALARFISYHQNV
jgi:hypothetical protein